MSAQAHLGSLCDNDHIGHGTLHVRQPCRNHDRLAGGRD